MCRLLLVTGDEQDPEEAKELVSALIPLVKTRTGLRQ